MGNFRVRSLAAQRQGNSGIMQQAKGAFTSGNLIAYDADGNAIDAGPRAITVLFDFGGIGLSATQSAPFRIPFSAVITSWSINIPSSGSGGTCTIKVWKKVSGTASPSSSDSINTSGLSLSTGTALTSVTLSDFTTLIISANDYIVIQVSAVGGSPIPTQIGFTLGLGA